MKFLSSNTDKEQKKYKFFYHFILLFITPTNWTNFKDISSYYFI